MLETQEPGCKGKRALNSLVRTMYSGERKKWREKEEREVRALQRREVKGRDHLRKVGYQLLFSIFLTKSSETKGKIAMKVIFSTFFAF